MAEVNWKWNDGIQRQATAAISRGLDDLANRIVKEAQRLMREPKSGRDYRTKAKQKAGAKTAERVAQRRAMRAAGQTTMTVCRG